MTDMTSQKPRPLGSLNSGSRKGQISRANFEEKKGRKNLAKKIIFENSPLIIMVMNWMQLNKTT